MTPRPFRPVCYTVRPFSPAPPQPKRRSLVNLVFALALTGLALLAARPAVYTVLTGDFPGSRLFYGLQEDDALVTALLDLHRAIGYGGPATANAGVVFGPESLYIGYEAVGQPGFFVCRYDTCQSLP